MKAFVWIWCKAEMFVFFLFCDCFGCTDGCNNSLIILNYFMEYINDLHISLKNREKIL